MNERTKAIIEKRRYDHLSISRIPPQTFLDFKDIAGEHCYDYGLTLKTLVDSFKEQRIINKFFMEKIGEKK